MKVLAQMDLAASKLVNTLGAPQAVKEAVVTLVVPAMSPVVIVHDLGV